MLKDNGFYFVPLGGSEQFGVNLNVYGCDGDLLAVDCGIGFADERFPGIDLLLPDPAHLEDAREKLSGMIITHAHEDHIGAVAHLWDRLECPLYATPFTAEILRLKLNEQGFKHVKVHEILPGQRIEIGTFHVEFAAVAHSIPDSVALRIETKYGAVLHSGDWNLDPAPVVGPRTEADVFKDIGKRGILAYIGDSTNADRPGRSGSEKDVAGGLAAVMKGRKGRIAVTIFSSNIGRVLSIARAAKACGRDVGVVGRSLHRMIGAGKALGYLDEVDFISEEDMGYLPDDRVVLIMTGSQGEYRSALAKAARGEHPAVSLKRGDCVIFSSRPIPGNEKEIGEVKNNLSAGGIDVVTANDTEEIIHVSGHPCQEEIADMFSWLKPPCVIPVHGERTQLEAHARFAEKCQVAQSIIPHNGTVIKLAPGKPEVVDNIETGLLAVDMRRIIPSDHSSIIERRKLQYTGTIHATLVLDAKGKIMAQPKVSTLGLIDQNDPVEKNFLEKLHQEIVDIIDDMSKDELADDHFVSEEMRIGLRRFSVHFLGIKPLTTIHLIRV